MLGKQHARHGSWSDINSDRRRPGCPSRAPGSGEFQTPATRMSTERRRLTAWQGSSYPTRAQILLDGHVPLAAGQSRFLVLPMVAIRQRTHTTTLTLTIVPVPKKNLEDVNQAAASIVREGTGQPIAAVLNIAWIGQRSARKDAKRQ